MRTRAEQHKVFAVLLVCVLLGQELPVRAGLASLNILPHRKLHKGRGVAEQATTKTSTATASRTTSNERNQTQTLPVATPAPSNKTQLVAPPAGNSSRPALTSNKPPVPTPLAANKSQLAPPVSGNSTQKAPPGVTKPASPPLPILAPDLPANRSSLSPPPRSKRLDIVLTHFHPIRTQPALDFWMDFLASDKVQQWEPYVFVYCQNENMKDLSELAPLLKHGGEVVRLPNVGRESHTYLQHIIRHHGDLADYTLFSQDIPDFRLVERFEHMFDNNTGFLPLSLLGRVKCKDEWLPEGQVPQLYAMLTNNLCPPQGYTGAFEGQFVVSRKRILANNWWVYKNLLDLLAAPLDHWIHKQHDNSFYKDMSNPFFGHVLERSWTLMFNCYDSWRLGNCHWCDNKMHMDNCGTDACQCLDTIPPGMN